MIYLDIDLFKVHAYSYIYIYIYHNSIHTQLQVYIYIYMYMCTYIFAQGYPPRPTVLIHLICIIYHIIINYQPLSYYTIVASKFEKPWKTEPVLHGSTGFLKTILILTMIPFDPSARISPLRVAKEIPARRTQRGSMASTFNDLGRWTMVDRGLRKEKKHEFLGIF